MIIPRIIALVGPDRVGKHSQSHILKEFLTGKNFKVKIIEVPTKYSIVSYCIIKLMLNGGLASKFPKFFQFIQFVNKFFFQALFFGFFILKYDIVIFDRWKFCAKVFGQATGINKNSWLIKLNDVLITPDITFALIGPPHSFEVERLDEYELNNELQDRVRNLYKEWAINNKMHNVHIVNANQGIYSVYRDIIDILKKNYPL